MAAEERLFEQVTVLLSFVYAIALTHLLPGANELVLERGHAGSNGSADLACLP